MSVNKNKPRPIDEAVTMEPDCDLSRSGALTGPPDDAAEQLVVLDDLAPASVAPRSLSSGDLRLLRALQSILEKRQADAWIDKMKTQTASELDWIET